MFRPVSKTDGYWRLEAAKADVYRDEKRKIDEEVTLTRQQKRQKLPELGTDLTESSGVISSSALYKMPYWNEACRPPDAMHTLANEVNPSA